MLRKSPFAGFPSQSAGDAELECAPAFWAALQFLAHTWWHLTNGASLLKPAAGGQSEAFGPELDRLREP
jgi:hypothetical protein